MNRAERRRLKKENEKEKTYTIRESDLFELKVKLAKQASERAFRMMLILPLFAAYDEFGFGRIRLARLEKYIHDLYFDLCNERLTLDELEDYLKEKTDFEMFKGEIE